ncbi:MAG: cyanophycinase [Candidatus Aminicenantes bacterium]|nr:cyanophycinase [Candidatus Aminicenantes bacterium]
MKKLGRWLVVSGLLNFLWLPGQSNGTGSLVIMGGNITSALERIDKRFIELGGGVERIRLAIIPAGSVEPAASGRAYAVDFTRLGVPAERIRIFPLAVVDDPSTKDVDESKWSGNGFSQELADDMLNYTAVFFVGGDQIRYNRTLKKANGEDSPLLKSIRGVYAAGGVIGGSSAGAAMMCDPMICEGSSMKALSAGADYMPDSCPEPRGVSLANGLGFFNQGMVDQHFLKRGRVGRLLMAIHVQPKAWLGVGIDEDTAAVCRGGAIEVLGSSGVVIIDTSLARAAGKFKWSPAGGMRAQGIVVHYLEEGDKFDIATRTPVPRPERKPIEKGKEANSDYPLETNVFGPDAFRNMLVDGIAENQKGEATGMSFLLDEKGRGIGSQWTLRKTGQSGAFYASINDIDTYTVTFVSLEIEPIALSLEKIR